jgi:DNA-binding MarR family transcriptional regulator
MDKLCDKNLIGRIACSDDRRVVHIKITDLGLRLLDTIAENMNDDYIKNLTEKEAAQLSNLLDKIR